MNSIARFVKRLSLLIHGDRFKEELDEEMAFHREQREKELREEGMAAEAAHHAAMRQFGNAARIKDQSHAVVGFRLESVAQDLRFAVRQLRKNPAFAFIAVLVLALGICASVAIFAFVDAALIKPLPYRDPQRLVAVTESAPMWPHANLSYLDYLDWKKRNTSFSSLDVWSSNSVLVSTPAGMELVHSAHVSAGFFRTLGVTPALGRDFTPGDDLPGGPHAVLLSYGSWQQRFNGRKDIVGQSLTLTGASYTIIGVLPREFQFAPRGYAEFWATLQGDQAAVKDDTSKCGARRGCHNLNGIARLKDGVSVATALSEMKLIAQQLEKQYPDTNAGQGAAVDPLTEIIVTGVRPILLLLLAGAGLLLLIACANVASLLLVRSESRKREIAVRGALGASRARLMCQFVTEGLVLVVAGCTLGLLAASGAMGLLIKLIPADMLNGMPYLAGLGLNLRVMLFAIAISLLAAILFSLAPLVRLPFRDAQEGLRDGGRTAAGTVWRRFGSNLVVLELAVAVVLLVGAGLLSKSFYRLLHVELGFQPDHLATVDVGVPRVTYKRDGDIAALGRRVVGRVKAIPGVNSAAIAMQLPVSFNGNTEWIRFVGRPYDGQHIEVNQRDVSSDYFTTLQAKLLRGRYFTDAEDASKPGVVIINETLAKKYYGDENPLGKKIGDPDLSPASLREIVGVVEDIKDGPLDTEIYPAVFLPFNQSPDAYFSVVVRTSQAEESVVPTLVAAIHEVDPNLATVDQGTMIGKIHDSPSAYLHRSSAWLVGGFAALALLLGVVGLYGVIAYSVSQRTREIGVRMALGAQRGAVYRLVLQEAGMLTVFGIVLGLVCSLGAAALMSKLLFGTRAWDGPTLAAVAVVLGLSALLASYFPARRAASVNPVEALRAE